MYIENRAHDYDKYSTHCILRIHIMLDHMSNTLCTLSYSIFITYNSRILLPFRNQNYKNSVFKVTVSSAKWLDIH